MMQTTHRQGVISIRHVRAITVVLIQDVFYPGNVSILLKHVSGDQSLEEFRAEIKRALLKFQATNKRITRSTERPSIRPSNESINHHQWMVGQWWGVGPVVIRSGNPKVMGSRLNNGVTIVKFVSEILVKPEVTRKKLIHMSLLSDVITNIITSVDSYQKSVPHQSINQSLLIR